MSTPVNRRKVQPVNVFPRKVAVILLMVAGLACGYLWLWEHCNDTAKRIKTLERELARQRRLRQNEEYKWANRTSCQNIEAALALHGLEMSWPEAGQIVHLGLSDCRFDDRKEYQLTKDDRKTGFSMAMR